MNEHKTNDVIPGMCCDCSRAGPCCDYSENDKCPNRQLDGSCWTPASPRIVKIAITGGPCAGKTTLMAKAVQVLNQRGVETLVCPESATTVFGSMNLKRSIFDGVEMQRFIQAQQFANEKLLTTIAEETAKRTGNPVVILCDRGKIDGLAYTETEDFAGLLSENGTNIIETRDSYDAVIFLVTAAIGAKEAYTQANNKARSESAEEAIEVNNRTLVAWTGHPHLSIIDNSTGFSEKIARSIQAILDVLGIPDSLERERKFLVWFPDFHEIEKYNPVKSEIIQTYLPIKFGVERRVRLRGDGKDFTCFYAEKKSLDSPTDRAERERMISMSEYMSLLLEADFTTTSPIHKKRYCFPYQNRYLELDAYAGETRRAILEVEFDDSNFDIKLPPEIEVIKEVTGDERYSNQNIASNSGNFPEDI